jgi:hypothetical protein
VPVAVALFSAIVLFYHASQPARKGDALSFLIFGVIALVAAILFVVPLLQPILVPIF